MPTNNLTRQRPGFLAKLTSATNPLTTLTKEIVTLSIMDICLDHLDLETRSLAIKMLRQDAKEALENMKGKQGQFDYDSKVALDAYLADLEAQTALALDRAMAQSMVQAIHHDERIIAAAVAQEEQAASDRQAALQLHRSGNLPQNPKPSKPDDNAIIDDELREKLEGRYNNRPRGDIHEGHDYPQKRTKTRPCLICYQEMDCCDLTRLPCSHEYCQGCLRDLFTKCLTDETMYPPRCCRQLIPETEMQIRIVLGGELLGKFLARKVEIETPNRTYCHRRDCTTFIPSQGIQGDSGTCPKCQSQTCCICKEAAHQGSDCPKDESAQILLELGAREGWKKCFGCGRMVELGYGCNHISKLSCPRCSLSSQQILTVLLQPVDAELSSATYVVRLGKRRVTQRNANAPCLTRKSLPARPRRQLLSSQSSTSSLRSDRSRLCSSRGTISCRTTRVSTSSGGSGGATTSVGTVVIA